MSVNHCQTLLLKYLQWDPFVKTILKLIAMQTINFVHIVVACQVRFLYGLSIMITKKIWFLHGNNKNSSSLLPSKTKPHGFMISKTMFSAVLTVLPLMIDVEICTSISMNIKNI
jgi:hypothetical protein